MTTTTTTMRMSNQSLLLVILLCLLSRAPYDANARRLLTPPDQMLVTLVDRMYNFTNAETNVNSFNNISSALVRLGNSGGFQGYNNMINAWSNILQGIGAHLETINFFLESISRARRLISLFTGSDPLKRRRYDRHRHQNDPAATAIIGLQGPPLPNNYH